MLLLLQCPAKSYCPGGVPRRVPRTSNQWQEAPVMQCGETEVSQPGAAIAADCVCAPGRLSYMLLSSCWQQPGQQAAVAAHVHVKV
jgi:hypothetical protein